jgi:uncharacterized protein (TIGR02145 family)
MKKIIPIIALFGLFVCVSCTHTGETNIIHNAVKDYDGNQYDAVRIGRKTWMKTNLRTTHYADGTPIPAGLGEDVRTPAYCEIPGVDAASYGLLYNWYAVMHNAGNPGDQGICPKGWHVPSTDEWSILVLNVSPYYDANYSNVSASALASQGGWEYYPPINMDSLHRAFDSLALIYEWIGMPWESSNEYYNASMIMNGHAYTPGADLSQNNTSGFAAVPAGIAAWEPSDLGKSAYFWTSNKSGYYEDVALPAFMYYNNPAVSVLDDYDIYFDAYKTYGLSVRCVKN